MSTDTPLVWRQVGGMAVEELDRSLSAYYDHFLYPEPKGKKSSKKSKKDL